ncbi:hypothetical protein Tco_1530869 [Tanacetum coccineum]
MSTIIRRLSHKLFRELLPFVKLYSGNIVSRNVLILGIPSPFVIVLTLWSLLLGPGAVPAGTTLSNSSYSAFDHDHDILVESRSWILQLASEPPGFLPVLKFIDSSRFVQNRDTQQTIDATAHDLPYIVERVHEKSELMLGLFEMCIGVFNIQVFIMGDSNYGTTIILISRRINEIVLQTTLFRGRSLVSSAGYYEAAPHVVFRCVVYFWGCYKADSIARTSSSSGVKHLIPSRLTRYLNLSSDKALVNKSATECGTGLHEMAMAAFESQYIDTYSDSAEDIEVLSCFLDDQLTNLSPPRNCNATRCTLYVESRQPA